jgi:hypothetical protein
LIASRSTEHGAEALAALLTAQVWGSRCDSDALDRVEPAVLLEAVEHHGLLPLLADRLSRVPIPGSLAATLHREASSRLSLDMFREADLRRTLAALDRAAVHPLVLKGAELAYTHYPRPDLRPRLDSDLLVPPGARATADEVLRTLGYEPELGAGGDLVTYQTSYTRRVEGQPAHVIDLHWRVANPQVFASLLDYEELVSAAVPIPALGPAARGLSVVHALLVACVHRVAHHLDSDRLIWLYDIHLLAGDLSNEAWKQVTGLAIQRRVAAIVSQSLARTADRFGTAIPAVVFEDLNEATQVHERSAAYLRSHRRHVQEVAEDLRELPTWRARARLMREHLLPPAVYMRRVYAPQSRAPLGLLYLLRAWRGARRWLVAR